MRLILSLIAVFTIDVHANSYYHDCRKLFNPKNYMAHLPSLSLPFVGDVPMPLAPIIAPSPTLKTKVISIVTTYIYRNPVCVKINGKKSPCKPANANNNNNHLEYIVTKEYFVNDRRNRHQQSDDTLSIDSNVYLQGSEQPRPFAKSAAETPGLSSPGRVQEMLIEDRLDQLETILPHYTRRRQFETSTITVTKFRTNNRATATLLVKNCVPQGYDLCPPKVKNRKSKVANYTNNTVESHYYG